MIRDDFEWRTREFIASIYVLLDDCFPDDTIIDSIKLSEVRQSASIKLTTPLRVGSLAKKLELVSSFRFCVNSSGNHLAVDSSSFKLVFKTTKQGVPIVRFEYDRNPRTKPARHFHFHSESVPLAVLLARAGRFDAAAQQHQIHFPMGGDRYRVCLEDVIELLAVEFGITMKHGWEDHVTAGKQSFYAAQDETIVRKNLDLAVRYLEDTGYTVTPPSSRSN